MRSRLVVFALLLALVVSVPATLHRAPVEASPADQYSGPYFGEDNFPPGCIRDMSPNNPDNDCYHMRTGLNALDSSQVDVVVMVPVSPTAERDMRIMRQSVEMWEGGIDYLSNEMGLGWLAEGVDFHITVDYFDPAGGEGGEFTTSPIVDPEIVVVATNPVGGIGIGIDPVAAVFTDPDVVPCHTVENPFDFEYWENLPGFDSHHDRQSGTFVKEDCGGAGGNICFAVNAAIDPAPDTVDIFSLFDLVSHEFGHCLTLGHVGDGAEGDWGVVPTNDIMAYNSDPPGLNKCVSTLDVESFAVRMSRYVDVNGDGAVNDADLLLTNDQIGQGGNPFHVQHPDDHLYASSTGSPMHCPQPDLGVVPGPRTDWTPTPVETTESRLEITSPDDGAATDDGVVEVTGTVEHIDLLAPEEPAGPTGSYDDADDDATTPVTEILSLDVAVTGTHVDATIQLDELWPTTSVASPTSYSLIIDGRKFDSFIRYAIDTNPMTWDTGAGAYMPAGTSSWDLTADTVTFHVPLDYLADAQITAPFTVASQANVGLLSTAVVDDHAPEKGSSIGVSAARAVEAGDLTGAVGDRTTTMTFEGPNESTFFPEDSSFGVPSFLVDRGTAHTFTLPIRQPSDVTFTLTWTGGGAGNDLDLYISGAADSGSDAATADQPEVAVLQKVEGFLDIRVDPFLVTDAVDGATYTLTATVTPLEGAEGPQTDSDGDGVADADDACPSAAGDGPDGCVPPPDEHVRIYLDGTLLGGQDVDTDEGRDSFAITVTVPEGTHDLLVVWVDDDEVVTTRTISVTTTSTSRPEADRRRDQEPGRRPARA